MSIITEAETAAEVLAPGVAPARLGLRLAAGVAALLIVGFILWWVFVHPGQLRQAAGQAKVESHLADAGATAATAAIAEQVVHDRTITTIHEITKEGENAVHSAAGADEHAPAVAAALGAALCRMRTYAAEPDCAALQADHRGVGPSLVDPGSFTPGQ